MRTWQRWWAGFVAGGGIAACSGTTIGTGPTTNGSGATKGLFESFKGGTASVCTAATSDDTCTTCVKTQCCNALRACAKNAGCSTIALCGSRCDTEDCTVGCYV